MAELILNNATPPTLATEDIVAATDRTFFAFNKSEAGVKLTFTGELNNLFSMVLNSATNSVRRRHPDSLSVVLGHGDSILFTLTNNHTADQTVTITATTLHGTSVGVSSASDAVTTGDVVYVIERDALSSGTL